MHRVWMLIFPTGKLEHMFWNIHQIQGLWNIRQIKGFWKIHQMQGFKSP